MSLMLTADVVVAADDTKLAFAYGVDRDDAGRRAELVAAAGRRACAGR